MTSANIKGRELRKSFVGVLDKSPLRYRSKDIEIEFFRGQL